MGEGGFEPPKSVTTDLQSAPFGRSGILPYSIVVGGAGGRTRTPDLLITNQLLYQLSYTSIYTVTCRLIPAHLLNARDTISYFPLPVKLFFENGEKIPAKAAAAARAV